MGMAPPSRGPYADVSRLAILRSMLAPVMRARLLCAERPHDRMVRYRLAQAKSAWREDFFEGDVASKIPPKIKVRLLDRSISRPSLADVCLRVRVSSAEAFPCVVMYSLPRHPAR